MTLRQLVEGRRFDSRNPRHRRALLEDELPGLAPELERIAQSYRAGVRTGSPAAASWLVQRFAMLVADPEADARRERHLAALREQAHPAGAKRCRRCGETKTAAEFPRNPRMRDGLHSWCRVCMAGAARRWREENAEYVAERNAARREGPFAKRCGCGREFEAARRFQVRCPVCQARHRRERDRGRKR